MNKRILVIHNLIMDMLNIVDDNNGYCYLDRLSGKAFRIFNFIKKLLEQLCLSFPMEK